MLELPPLWPHQRRGLEEVVRLINEGVHRIVLCSPTGGGKTRLMLEMIRWGWPTLLLTNRTMLLEQTAARLDEAGIPYGIRAAGYKPDLEQDVQLSSIQTEWERVYQSAKWLRHPSKLVLIDERHNQKGATADTLLADYALDGAVQIGLTATPLDLDGKAEALVVAGTTSELRDSGALLWAHTYAPDEPTAKAIRTGSSGGFTEPSVQKAMMAAARGGIPTVYGRIMEHWRRLNPEAKPTIAFAPGVRESLWFAQQCTRDGVPSAHIDGSEIWINGEYMTANTANRDKLREASESGEIKIVFNRMVMREGIDWTHLYHGILATVFGSLSAYLQSVGRLLRAHPGMDHVIIQDHGGNWWRHGSANQDREWDLKLTTRIEIQRRERAMRERKEAEPIVCPRCSAVRLWGRQCAECGFAHHTRPRMVIDTDGELREVNEAIHKPRRVSKEPTDVIAWKRTVWRCREAGRTFAQAEALFAREHNWHYPDRSWPLMPKHDLDWFRRVADVLPKSQE